MEFPGPPGLIHNSIDRVQKNRPYNGDCYHVGYVWHENHRPYSIAEMNLLIYQDCQQKAGSHDKRYKTDRINDAVAKCVPEFRIPAHLKVVAQSNKMCLVNHTDVSHVSKAEHRGQQNRQKMKQGKSNQVWRNKQPCNARLFFT